MNSLLEIMLMSILCFMVAWLVLAMSLNLRDTRKKKRFQRRRQQVMAKHTVPVEQVMRMAEWKMKQWMIEQEKLN